MKPRHKRFAAIAAGIAALGIGAALVLTAFQKNLVFLHAHAGRRERSAPGPHVSRRRSRRRRQRQARDGVTVHFVVTDTAKSIPVVYKGLLPDLFREGKAS